MQIRKQEDLEALLQRIDGCRALAIDTEFVREKTYYPLLCLVQLATDEGEYLVDPLSVNSLKPMAKILTDPRTVKIFHAGRQDRELLYRECGVAASPVFDTQTAAPLLGMPQQVGYGTAVSTMCGVKLKKADSLTDWTIRPLSGSQIQYSLEDVRYLIPMYDKMTQRLQEMGRLHWLDAEFAQMGDPNIYHSDDRELWTKVKKANSLPKKQLVHVQNIAMWRESIARKRNIPRRWVLSDELLIEICKREPRTVEDLYRIRGAHEKLTNAMANHLVKLIAQGKASDPSTWPVQKRTHRISVGADAVADVLMGILRMRAKQNDVAPQVLATHDDLMELASGVREGIDIMEGWRFEMVGRELVAFLDGNETVGIGDGQLTTFPRA